MLDERDKLLFEYLLNDCRIATTQLSKKLKLSQPSIVYRINKLKEKGIINRYDAVFDFSMLPDNIYFFFLSVPQDKLSDIEKLALNEKSVVSFFYITNKSNVYLLLNSSSGNIDKFIKKIEQFNYQYFKLEEISFLPYSIFDNNINSKKILNKTLPYKLDKTDWKIISYLMNGGGRDSILEMSKNLGISYDIVQYRFLKLKKAGYFPIFTAQPGMKLYQDMILLKTYNLDYIQLKKLLSYIKKIPWIVKVEENTFIFQLITTSFDEYRELLEKVHQNLDFEINSLEILPMKKSIFFNRFNF